MSTEHQVPWADEYDWAHFRAACADIKQNFELTQAAPSSPVNTDDLMWRHWVVSFAVRKALLFSERGPYCFVECGVGDGLTSFFMLKEIEHQGKLLQAKIHLYDAWQAMEKERLIHTEQAYAGKYSNLSLERTQKNLLPYKDLITYHVGYIPDTFSDDPPESIIFLHVDLNSSIPTLSALQFFLPRMDDLGVILFDDYGDFNHAGTKKVVDEFFQDQPGILEKIPTGQAIYYHRKVRS